MARYKLTLEYDGTNFVGWQRQDNGLSIQEVLEDAAKAFCGEDVAAFAAGRTDAGVHALAMTAHIEIEKAVSADKVRDAINHHMRPHPISILSAEAADDDFHARFSCKRRAYEYRIVNRRSPLALDVGRAWRVPQALDAEAMHEAAQCLVGKHDFTTYRAATCQSDSPVKTLDEISVSRMGEDVFIRCVARSFLHHQVRSITGSLVEVGKGKWRVRDMKAALEAADRTRCGQVAPAEGLYFVRAEY
ncbi:tRNA pseudouridine(38-40) synthase TruA [Hyphococcus luteus]|uniref:tRNA pseudouridine synthase A n=1 Tax=Hyphococcus luteus TaxID=2058213 RepID=A0A2S7K6I2_9PROT|nr:tRNA pseudouridine(38-40) synthase TruA [Marinicaulis flavus]PQA88124.1 tRNA pseudouridine(38-40) synthase TruA [Marinicaulis flavus]